MNDMMVLADYHIGQAFKTNQYTFNSDDPRFNKITVEEEAPPQPGDKNRYFRVKFLMDLGAGGGVHSALEVPYIHYSDTNMLVRQKGGNVGNIDTGEACCPTCGRHYED